MPKPTVLDALPFIRMAAKRLSPRLCSADYDEEDLGQEIALDVHRKIGQFDPGRGTLARFVWIIPDHRVAEIRRHECIQRHDCRRDSWSLNEPIVGDAERGAFLSLDDYEMAFGRRSRSEAEMIEMRHDVNRTLASVSPLLRLAAVTVMFDGIKFAMSAAESSRSTINRRLKAVREVFECGGLRSYVRRAA